MAQFQPDIMVVDCFDQNGYDTGAVGTQRVGKNLIAYQGAIFRGDLIFIKALTDSLGKRFLGMRDTINAILFAKDLHPVLVAVGHHAKLNVGFYHFFQPVFHFLSRDAGGVRHDGIIKVQHQEFDAAAMEKFRAYIC